MDNRKLHITLNEQMIRDIDEYRKARNNFSKAEAVRRLIDDALQTWKALGKN